jgi:hypothetical protein
MDWPKVPKSVRTRPASTPTTACQRLRSAPSSRMGWSCPATPILGPGRRLYPGRRHQDARIIRPHSRRSAGRFAQGLGAVTGTMTNTNHAHCSQGPAAGRLRAFLLERTLPGHRPGVAGGVLAIFTAILVINVKGHAQTTVNGRSTTPKCGKPGSGTLLRADCANSVAAERQLTRRLTQVRRPPRPNQRRAHSYPSLRSRLGTILEPVA